MTGKSQNAKFLEGWHHTVLVLIAAAILVFATIPNPGAPDTVSGAGTQAELALAIDDPALAAPATGDAAEACGAGPGCISEMLEVDGMEALTGVSETPAPGSMAGAHTQAGPPLDHPPISL
jgi:hypothetical protein